MVFDERPHLLVSALIRILSQHLSVWRSEFRHLGIFSATLVLTTAAQASESPVLLKTENRPGALTRIQAVVEIAGELKLNPDGKQVSKLPLKGKGELVYDERLLAVGTDDKPRRDVRHYQKGDARFAVGDGEIVSQLSSDRRVIGVQSTNSQSLVFSLQGPLSRDELELIDIQGSSSLLSRLLPDMEVSVGDKWAASHDTAAVFLRLDVVTENKLESHLQKIEDQVAFVEMTGRVSGSIGGVPSDLDVTAKYNFDLRLKRISWLAMSIHENRAIGHAEPGFDVTARVRVSISPLESSPELAEDVLAKLPLVAEKAATFLTCTTSDGAFRLMYPRSWRVMVDRHDVTILRFVDQGEMIAQCNLSKLTDAAPDKLLSMETFQADIQRSLAKNFGEFVEGTQFKTDRGLRALRVVVAGLESELPIQWIYYHLTDDHGRQAAVVFTMDSKLVERFGGEDQTLVSAFEILAAPATNGTSTAAKTATEKKPGGSKEKR